MSLTKEVKVDKIEVVNGVNIQVREVVSVKENGEVISQSYNRKAFSPSTFSVNPENGDVKFVDTNLSGQEQIVQDIAGASWTKEAKKAWQDQITAQNKKS
jgi:hypothetical protein|tara:strand:- start:49 stop:348 length:300 start_codon:yes stop_codon:yes gene_type:complete